MPGVKDRCKRNLGLPDTESILIHQLLDTTCIILHHYWNVMLVPFNCIDTQIPMHKTYFSRCLTAAYCSPPQSPVNGTVHSMTGTKLGSTLRFSCDQGFRLIGQSSATCTRTPQGIYQWNAPVPLCQGEFPATTTVHHVHLSVVWKRKGEKCGTRLAWHHFSNDQCCHIMRETQNHLYGNKPKKRVGRAWIALLHIYNIIISVHFINDINISVLLFLLITKESHCGCGLLSYTCTYDVILKLSRDEQLYCFYRKDMF